MARSTAAALVIALASGAAAQSQCPGLNKVQNGNFDSDHVSTGFLYTVPDSWQSWLGNNPNALRRAGVSGGPNPRTILVNQGNRPWGGLRSNNGVQYLSMQGRYTTIEQNISGLTVGSPYELSFLSAERPGYGNAERLTITMGSTRLYTNLNPQPQFTRHTTTFNATSSTMLLRFQLADTSISSPFLDDVSVCPITTTCAFVANGDFEQDAHGATHAVAVPTGWTKSGPSNGRAYVAMNGNAPWGRLNSGSGVYYAVLQRAGTTLSQTLSLTQGQTYAVNFLLAERPGYNTQERLRVLVNGQALPGATSINAPSAFQAFQFTFTAGSTTTLAFTNVSPASGDQSVFIDSVTVCAVATTPAPTPLTTTRTATSQTTTQTATTHTYAQSFTNIRSALTQFDARINALNTSGMMTSNLAASLSNQQSSSASTITQLSLAQTNVIGQINSITSAISTAVGNLPPASTGGSSVVAAPSVGVTSDGNLLIAAPGADVQFESMCGVMNPCDMMAALQALRGAGN